MKMLKTIEVWVIADSDSPPVKLGETVGEEYSFGFPGFIRACNEKENRTSYCKLDSIAGFYFQSILEDVNV